VAIEFGMTGLDQAPINVRWLPACRHFGARASLPGLTPIRTSRSLACAAGGRGCRACLPAASAHLLRVEFCGGDPGRSAAEGPSGVTISLAPRRYSRKRTFFPSAPASSAAGLLPVEAGFDNSGAGQVSEGRQLSAPAPSPAAKPRVPAPIRAPCKLPQGDRRVQRIFRRFATWHHRFDSLCSPDCRDRAIN
jgi:hypothetical protein